MSYLDPIAMDPIQIRHLADAREFWRDYGPLAVERKRLRGAMGWKTVKGREYLTWYITDPFSGQKTMRSIGPRSPQTEAKKAEFDRRRPEVDAAIERLKERLAPLIRVGKALRIGRLEPAAGEVLRTLGENALLGPDLMVIGGAAMHLYECSAGALLPASIIPAGDLDLMTTAENPGDALDELLPVLRRADKSFRIHDASGAVRNEDGFRVHLHIRRSVDDLRTSDEQAGVLHCMLQMAPVRTVAIARDGMPAEMIGIDPRAFALIKYAFANLGPRRMGAADRLAHDQALAVGRLVARFGSRPFDPEQLAAFPVFAEQVEAGDPEAAEAVDDTAVHHGSGNFLADRGIEDPDEFRVKAHLCNEIASILEVRKLTQEKAAGITGQKQADLSRIVNSRFDDYSVWRLMKILSALGTDVLIAVNQSGGTDQGVILAQTMEPEERG